jgi:ABC-type branched-subunit amino acid transport system substrate-binding protein
MAVVAAAMTLAACAGGATAPAPEPIRIGSLLPISELALPHFLAALQASARDVNAHGGIRGHPVRIENCDDHEDPNLAEACARRLVSDRVVATASDVTSLSMVEAPILDEAGIPQVGGEALNPEDTSLPTAFPFDGGATTQLAGMVAGIRRRGLHTLFVFSVDVPAGRLAGQIAAQMARAAGVQLVGQAYAPSAATDYSPWVQMAVQSRADVVAPAVLPIQLGRFLTASKQAGARYLVTFPYGDLTPRDIQRLGGSGGPSENSVEFAALPPVTAVDRFPALRTFAADMDAELAAGDPAAGPGWRTGGPLTAWLSVQIIAAVASTLPVIDAAQLLAALRTSPAVDTMGLTPPWTPGRRGPPAFPRITNGYGYFITQSHGVDVLVDPTPFDTFQLLGVAPP